MQVNDIKDHLIKLLFEDREKAVSFALEVKELIDSLPLGEAVSNPKPSNVNNTEISVDHDPEFFDKNVRNETILEVAKTLYKSDGCVRTAKVAQILKRNNIPMGVPDNRITTAVSNILIRKGDYEKVSDGAYKPKGDKNDNVSFM